MPPRAEEPGLGPAGPARPLREAVVAFTAEVRGEIEPCGCPTVPYGGFARRARLLDALRAEGLPVFVLDAGEMLVKGQDARDAADRPARAHAVLDLARGVGLDAWAPGASDLVPGGLALLGGTGALSATWRDAAGQPVLPASTVIERDGFRLGVVGLSGRATGLSEAAAVDAVRDAVSAPADVWVVLSNASPVAARAVAEQVPGLAAVLSVRGERHDDPLITAGAPVVETPDRGRYVTVLRLSLACEPGPLDLVEEGPWAEAARTRARRVLMPDEAARRALTEKLAATTERVAEATAGHNVALVETRPLGSDLDGASPVDDRLAAFKVAATEEARARVDRTPEVAGYATSSACVSCHRERFFAWTYSEHARAYESLVARRAGADVECLPCHTTGWGEPGGNAATDGPAMRTWKAVQCEACHGPLAGHPSADVPVRPVSRDTCTRCHDEANSPQFDYASYLKRISCSTVAAGR